MPFQANNPFYIVMHHSAVDDNDGANDLEYYRKFHTAYVIDGVIVTREDFYRRKKAGEGSWFREPWDDIGYHFVIERRKIWIPIINLVAGIPMVIPIPEITLVLGHGRDVNYAGIHSRGVKDDRMGTPRLLNQISIGICISGNFDKYEPDDEKWNFAAENVASLAMRHDIPIANIIGHRDMQPEKSCPGTKFDMRLFRTKVVDSYNPLSRRFAKGELV